MDKKKRKVCFAFTVVGVIIIIIVQTIILIDDEAKEKKENYIKVNVVKAAKECIKDVKCEESDITLLTLIENRYIDGYFLNEINEYSSESVIKYPSYEVELKRED